MSPLTYYVRRARELGLRESVRQAKTIVRDRAAASIHNIRDRYFSSTLEENSDRSVNRLFRQKDFLRQIRIRQTPRFFLDREPDFYREAIRNFFPDEESRIVSAADRVKGRVFDVLGSGPTSLPNLPWQVDFKSGFRWDGHTHYREIRYGNVSGVDVKVPWELSRFQHAILLGEAYWLTGNEDYTEEFKTQVLDWIRTNPSRYGVNWACTMDVGIRAVNWIWGFYFFRKSPVLDHSFVRTFLKSLHVHASFIRSNLEYRTAVVDGRERRLNSNHYLSNLIGLLYIGLLFPELDEDNHLEFAENELCLELLEQTYPDGVDYEHSTFYHRLVTEIFLSGFLLLQRNGHSLPSVVQHRLQSMAEYVADYLRPDGTAPQIGDADNGRLHPLALREMADHRYIPITAGEAFGRDDLRIREGDIEALWWIAATPRLDLKTKRARLSSSHADNRFVVLQCAHAHAFITAASVGMHGLGSHSHNDILSFEYWSQGRAWIVDPGTYLYTPDPASRNYFRSTEAHNTVRIDGSEINTIQPERLFQLSDRARVNGQVFTEDEASVQFEAEHTGYEVRHRRSFQMHKQTGDLTIEDSFAGSGRHEFEWFFHLSPGTEVDQTGSRFILRRDTAAITLLFDAQAVRSENKTGWYSPSYGIRESAPLVSFRLTQSRPTKVRIQIINSYAPDSPSP